MAENEIVIKGACEHNLKNINLALPRNKLIVITGLSGSGKSSLAFDTLYAEGQRRYIESLSAYARQFLEQLKKPNIDYISGLPPAIAIEQRKAVSNPRSTVATTTEIYDYLRLLFARVGIPHCPKCGRVISRQSLQEICERIEKHPSGVHIQILAPIVRGRKGEYRELFPDIEKSGFVKVRVDGKIYDLAEKISLARYKMHRIEVIIDELSLKEENKSRLAESIQVALKLGKGLVIASLDGKESLYSENYACPHCDVSFEELTPRMFSFNSPYGACPVCKGLGFRIEVDPDLVIPNKSKTLYEGAIKPWHEAGGRGIFLHYRRKLRRIANHLGYDLDSPVSDFKKKDLDIILYGSQELNFEGVIHNLERRMRETESEFRRTEILKYMRELPCPACKEGRLREESLAVTIEGKSILDITRMSITQAMDFFSRLKLEKRRAFIASQILKEIKSRLEFMSEVGLDYLTLDRMSHTLSGGEAERTRLATQIGSGLVGVLYILDEPTIGLHQRDNRQLLATLKRLRDLGNTVVIIEHDETTIRTADYLVDLGPGAGLAGGKVVAKGNLQNILECKSSLTGKYLKGELKIKVSSARRKPKENRFLRILGAAEHNLKNIDVKIPLGLFICVTGVSGSGKSTLVDEILRNGLNKIFYHSKEKPGKHKAILGANLIDKVVLVDQSPIGRTPRSNPATYTGLFSPVREVFSRLPESKMRGYKPGRFSFNVKDGRCGTCQGDGITKIEMHFLPDIEVPCEVCQGKRYNRETLEIRFKGKNIAEVLAMKIEKALKFFENIPSVRGKLETLNDVGLGYLELGQSATTLSGGEAQRVKLATELSRKGTERTLYLLDEPTTGLHFADIEKLLKVLNRLVDKGSTVMVIEHQLDVVKNADYIIDLGPEGGERGGYVVAAGTPEEIAASPRSYTGKYLKEMLSK